MLSFAKLKAWKVNKRGYSFLNVFFHLLQWELYRLIHIFLKADQGVVERIFSVLTDGSIAASTCLPSHSCMVRS